MYKEWIVSSNSDKKNQDKSFLERLLASRGIIDEKEIREFLNPLEIILTHPNAFNDMQKAVARIVQAIEKEEQILVYGDFDADGVTSTSLLMRTFSHLGAKVDYFIPDREQDGHGMNTNALVKLLTKVKPKLIITVDNGISNIAEVTFVKSFNVDVIITDHHEAGDELPDAFAIINPKAPFALNEKLSAREINNLASLAGVGVAFKLAQALLEHYEKTEFVYEIIPYVAVGTIADVVPLIGENRYFVAKGLQLIASGKHYGLKRLLEVAGYNLDNGLTAEQIGFGVAPRINASGRLDTVTDAMKVMISDNKQEIEMAIISLNNFNKIRQDLCQQTFLEADEMLQKEGNKGSAIVLFKPDWHIGIIGIVASKLVEKYYKPTFIMTYSEETNQIRCSARSIEEIHLYDAISNISELLEGFGGHSLAAGLSFDKEKHSFEEVKTALNKTIKEMLGEIKPVPNIKIDMELLPQDIDTNLVESISQLEPFGASNPSPIFTVKNLILKEKKLMGSNKDHLRLTVQAENQLFNCIWWSKGDISLVNGDKLDIAFAPQLNTFNGETSVQLILQDIHSEALIEVEPTPEVKVYDHRKKTDILNQVNDYVKNSKLSIGIFAEDKNILEKLKSYKDLTERVVNRQTLFDLDALMFFDYPVTEDAYNEIIEKTNPSVIHYMSYEVPRLDTKLLLKTFSGMIRFVCNNKNGKFNLMDSAVFLATTTESIEILLNIFEEIKMIEISEKNKEFYTLKFVENVDIAKALHTKTFGALVELLAEIESYKNDFANEITV